MKKVSPVKEPTNPGLIVLQWLTYAFWGWTVLALSFLTVAVVTNFIDTSAANELSKYGIAAVLVLLPISYICELYFSRKEPAKKTGAAIWVMVIHAVIFALFGIGALIAAVISLVVLFTSSGDSKNSIIALISSLIIAVFYAVTFLRTLNPGTFRWMQKWFKFIMLVAVGIIVILGLIGPVARERITRDDRLIRENIGLITSGVDNYVNTNKKLPATLDALSLRGDAKRLVERGLVEYRRESTEILPATAKSGVTADGASIAKRPPSTTGGNTAVAELKYQLCATYKADYTTKYTYTPSSDTDADGYSMYLLLDDYKAGRTCYKMKSTGGYY